jgi:acetyl esterase/lipase
MNTFVRCTALFASMLSLQAADTPTKSTATPYPLVLGPIRLWEGDAPGARGQRPQDIPTLTPFAPEKGKRNGGTVLIFPGGGYANLAEHEGTGYAEWFVKQGFTAYVLKYRLGSNGYHHPIELGDASRALRMVRGFARRDGLDPQKILVIGSSAGGHLAASLVTHFDAGKMDASDPIERESSRPDFGILCYPVITFGEFAHAGSRKMLLGDTPSPALVKEMSPELNVKPDTPPCFIWSTMEDRTVPVENSLLFASALRKAGVPFSLHIYEKGPHGLGLGRPGRPAPPWDADLLYWLHEHKLVP